MSPDWRRAPEHMLCAAAPQRDHPGPPCAGRIEFKANVVMHFFSHVSGRIFTLIFPNCIAELFSRMEMNFESQCSILALKVQHTFASKVFIRLIAKMPLSSQPHGLCTSLICIPKVMCHLLPADTCELSANCLRFHKEHTDKL